MKTLIVLPAHNEEAYLATVLKKVLAVPFEVIVVDDGSHDATAKIAKKHTAHVLSHEVNLGKGAAMLTGAEYAFEQLQADAVVFLDSDDQHDPAEIPRFVAELEKGRDLVFGVRLHGTDMPLVRYLGNKTASVFLNLLFGQYIPDIPSGYKALSRKGFSKVRWNSTGYSVEAEIAARTAKANLPYAVIEIAAIYHDTDKGMTILDGLKIAWHLLQWRLEL